MVKYNWKAHDQAEEALKNIDPDTIGDQALAELIADYVTVHGPFYRLSILHNYRESPCPMRYDWKRKNCFGIKTRDRSVARQWAIDATMRGYAVFWSSRIYGSGSGYGSLASARKRAKIAAAVAAAPSS